MVFDLDGTLVRLPIDYESLFEEFRRIMRVADVRPLVDTISRVDGRTRELVFGAWEKAELAVLGKVVANDESGWVALDFTSVVAHIFYEPMREFYSLERLWSDAKKVRIPRSPGKQH